MIVAGCDVGTLTAKAVILNDESMISFNVITVKADPEKSAADVMGRALSKAGLSLKDIDCCVGIGQGRKKIPFADLDASEIVCLGKGAHWLVPSARTVIDVGCQTSKALSIDENGRVMDFSTNDRCAAGTGRFLEVMADALELKLEELGLLALRSKNPANISSQCSVFAESEVVSLLNEGKDLVDIVAGIHESIAGRLSSQVMRVGIKEDAVVTGGCAKNDGLVKALEERLGLKMRALGVDPQIVGAIGAALFAKERLSK